MSPILSHTVNFIIYNLFWFLKGVFSFLLFYFFYDYFIVETHFCHNFGIYYKYVIRKGNGPLFQVDHLKSQSFFILIPAKGNLSRPPLRQFPKIYLPFPMKKGSAKAEPFFCSFL